MTESPEEKRGKKRTLDQLESNAIDAPNPKRRKLSPPSTNHIIPKNDDNENKQQNSHSANTTNNHNNHNNHTNTNEHHPQICIPNKQQQQDLKIPNAKMIDLLDSDSPTTNTPDISPTDIEMKDIKHNPPLTSIIKHNTDPNKHYDYLSIYTDERCLMHCIPDTQIINEFNERPERLQALLSMIENESWSKCCRFISSLSSIPTLSDIEGLHSAEYLVDLKNSCSKIYAGNWNVAAGSDTYIVKQTFDAALISAGLVIEATKHVFSHIPPLPFPSDNIDNMDIDDNNDADTQQIDSNIERKYAVVLNRPPGHHCDGEKYSGYCYINSTAVAIEKQLNEDTKVLVLDIDVHHGDGTQKLFYNEATVLTVSFHQYDGNFFPSSGLRTEYGPSRRHAAYGTNVNIPLGGQSSDLDVLYALRNMVWNIVEKFKPDIAFYAVGTDGVANDKANNATIFTPNLYGQIAYELREYVKLIVVTTEGGYTTDYLSMGMSAVLHGLTGEIDTEYYPKIVNENDILASTVHNVAATTSDLRRVYDFEQDPEEIKKIFNIGSQSVESELCDGKGGSMYIPNDDDDDYNENDGYFEEDDEEFFSENEMNKNKNKNEKKKKKKVEEKKHINNKKKDSKKKKKKKDKHKKDKKDKKDKVDAIDLTGNDDCDNKSKKKKDKKSKKKKKKKKKHKKKKDKDKTKEKRMVSKTVLKKNRTNSVSNDNKENGDNGVHNDVEVINLIDDSPIIENGDKKKKKKKKKKKDKEKKKHKNKDNICERDENSSDINNMSHSTICTLSGIIGMGITDLAIRDISDSKMQNKTNTASTDVIVIDSE